MNYWYIGIAAVWLSVTFYALFREWYAWKYQPARWNSRFHGLISLSDRDRFLVEIFWPVAIVGVIGVITGYTIFAFFLSVVHLVLGKPRKAPKILKLRQVQFTKDGPANMVLVTIEGKKIWAPARDMGLDTFANRMKCAKEVFMGRADALIWPEDEQQ